jgi:hypothetical protein
MKKSGLGLKLSQGNGLRMAGGMCQGCGSAKQNDKFLFGNQKFK